MSEQDVTDDLTVPWDEDPSDLYDHAPCGYLTTLPDGTIVRVNETFLRWTGYQRADLIGRRHFRDLLSSGGQIYHETHYAPLLAMQDDVHEVAFDMMCSDGRRFPTLVNSTLTRDPEGRPRAIRTTVFNATERRGYERELVAARRAAEASEKQVGVLQQIVADLAAAPTEAEVAEVVVRAPGPAFGAAGTTLWLVDPDRELLTAAASTEPDGIARDDMPLSSPHPVAAVARRRDIAVLGSIAAAEQQFPELVDGMWAAGRRAVVLLPLTTLPADDPGVAQVLGVLAFGFAEERELGESELRVVRLLGHQAGQALDRARLYDDARRRESRAVWLAETTRALDEIPRLRPRAHRLVERIVPDVAEWAAVSLQVGPTLLVADAGGPEPDEERLAERVARVITSGEAWISADDDPDPNCAVLPLTARG